MDPAPKNEPSKHPSETVAEYFSRARRSMLSKQPHLTLEQVETRMKKPSSASSKPLSSSSGQSGQD
ncbi:hypothetical protein [Verrucomicrobium spinosum]|uniref:hypothetical protein n=1 Tax=Verrucomicrobium spinosum TaxID=2736 RepID=UPI00017449C8|nr:hypothetical protein [Verrucomicrobium spinosum]